MRTAGRPRPLRATHPAIDRYHAAMRRSAQDMHTSTATRIAGVTESVLSLHSILTRMCCIVGAKHRWHRAEIEVGMAGGAVVGLVTSQSTPHGSPARRNARQGA